VVSVVPATEQARQELFTAEHPNCIDALKAEHMASKAADDTMPGLKGYDFVLAASTDPSCDGDIGGIADSGGDRHADIYDVGGNPESDIVAAAHELEHTF